MFLRMDFEVKICQIRILGKKLVRMDFEVKNVSQNGF